EDLWGFNEEIVARAAAAGVRRIVSIGSDLEDSARNVALASEFPGVLAAVGVHPTSVHEVDEDTYLDALRFLAAEPKVVAIGEIGLDFYHPPQDGSPVEVWRTRQERFFRAQLELAESMGLPAVIHQRECAAEVDAVLRDYDGRVRVVLHCFNGGAAAVRDVTHRGRWVSFTGIATFPKATEVHEAVVAAPEGRFMLETDAPYLAPVPYRGKRCEPAHVRHTAERVADLRGCSLQAISAATERTATEFFRMSEIYKSIS
ncbi:MAG: TatD family hydrolase, partial [Verrucomicrobiae bacterium]|nr:TatD family hydrolase [Verrucomicrobiae bacterium]